MIIYRIHITSWTASFRYPNMISGFQPTLPVPPMSTINGLISAAMGNYFIVTKEKLGFVFSSKGKQTDLETIYQMGNAITGIKSNVVKREFLYDVDLILYTDSIEIKNAFENPFFPLLLGRSSDLATVRNISELLVKEMDTLQKIKGTIIPFVKYPLPSQIQALPIYFTNSFPRQNRGTKPYCLLPFNYQNNTKVKAKGIKDKFILDNKEFEWDVYWQEIYD